MKYYAYTVNLKDDPEAISKYTYHHDHIWPEVSRSLREIGILDLRIWIKGRRLFMMLVTPDSFDPSIDLPRYLESDPRCREWEELMTTFQEPVAEAGPGEKWTLMEEIFAL